MGILGRLNCVLFFFVVICVVEAMSSSFVWLVWMVLTMVVVGFVSCAAGFYFICSLLYVYTCVHMCVCMCVCVC